MTRLIKDCDGDIWIEGCDGTFKLLIVGGELAEDLGSINGDSVEYISKAYGPIVVVDLHTLEDHK